MELLNIWLTMQPLKTITNTDIIGRAWLAATYAGGFVRGGT